MALRTGPGLQEKEYLFLPEIVYVQIRSPFLMVFFPHLYEKKKDFFLFPLVYNA